MCGLIGTAGKNINQLDIDNCILAGKELLKERGPDAFGYKVSEKRNSVLCQSLLSITNDVGLDKQPFFRKKIISSFNGEIYNYRDLYLKNIELFENTSINEIEVISKLYQNKGLDFLNDLNGMFAIAIYSEGTNEFPFEHILLARDRFGVKPLFYSDSLNNKLIYSSSCYSFEKLSGNKLNSLDISSASSLLTLGHMIGSNTLIKGAKQVDSGSAIIYNIEKSSLKQIRYWSKKDFAKIHENKKIKEDELYELLLDSISMRSSAHQGVGCLLSGGIDSTLISAIYDKIFEGKIRTYSLGFKDNRFDETKDALYSSKLIGTDHKVIVYPGLYPQLIENVLHSMHGFPIGDTSSLCSYFLYKEISKYERSFMGGDGGDEIFGGYSHYKFSSKIKKLDFIPISLIIKIIKKLKLYRFQYMPKLDRLFSLSSGFNYFHLSKQRVFWQNDLEKLFINDDIKKHSLKNDPMEFLIREQDSQNSDFSEMRIIDLDNKFYNMLLPKTDMMSMANSVEVREPLLDFRLVTMMLSKGLHSQIYHQNESRPLQKTILRKILPKYNFNKVKQGFSSPVDSDIRNKKDCLNFFEELFFRNDHIINKNFSQELIKRQMQGENNSSRIFSLAALLYSIEKLKLR